MLPNNNSPQKETCEESSSHVEDNDKMAPGKGEDNSTNAHNSSIKQERQAHTLLGIFLGYTIDTHDKIIQVQKKTDKTLQALQNAYENADKPQTSVSEQIKNLKQIKSDLEVALDAYKLSPWQTWLYQWSLVLYYILIDIGMVVIVEFYCRWHGASFFSLNLYAPANIEMLSKINFVNGPTTLSIAAEVLTWSSVGVWAQQNYANTILLIKRKFRFAENTLEFVGILTRNTSVASIVIILLRISKFSIFGVSLDATNPLMFDITLGLSFLLGFFGDDAYRILKGFKDQLMKGISNEHENTQKDN